MRRISATSFRRCARSQSTAGSCRRRRPRTSSPIRAALGNGSYDLEFLEAVGGRGRSWQHHLGRTRAVHGELEPGRMAPVACPGFTDSHFLREAFGTTAYGYFSAQGDGYRSRHEAHPFRTSGSRWTTSSWRRDAALCSAVAPRGMTAGTPTHSSSSGSPAISRRAHSRSLLATQQGCSFVR